MVSFGNGNLCSGDVSDKFRDETRADFFVGSRAQPILCLRNDRYTGHRGTNDNAHAVACDGAFFDSGISKSLCRSGVAVLHKQIHLAALFLCHKIVGIKVFHLRSNLYRQFAGIKAGNVVNAAFSIYQIIPVCVDTDSDRGYGTPFL